MPDTESESLFIVFFSKQNEKCSRCSRPIMQGALLCVYRNQKLTCTGCEGLGDHLLLPAGDVALTRRATKHSNVAHPVYSPEKRRNRYERRGTLVEAYALQLAEAECEADAADREVKRAKDAVRREKLDQEYIAVFAMRIRQLYPSCPEGLESEIAMHACEKHSGRVGRREAAREELDDESLKLAVRAHIRHTETPYDKLFERGYKKEQARDAVIDIVNRVERKWAVE
ncbi:DUF2293 domain-containing protein [Verrucomicrobium spinosum]|uniref:DUF2293 domain-containing protein n=2 Tax=Verrucomicrobium spinosum TaxID=2736 RepID=UPI0001745D87|nr:DUF2293 domain-containing protein [Verrucomicrobium spinosum]